MEINTRMTTYENTRSGAYKAARYVILPELMATVTTVESFHLLTQAGIVFDRLLAEGRLPGVNPNQGLPDNTYGEISMRRLTLWQVDNIARQTGMLEKVGNGWWRNKTADEVIAPFVDEIETADGLPEFDGWIYAFTFPSIERTDGPFRIKVGKATDVDARVTDQTRGSAFFEYPKILGRWQVKRVGNMERAIHDILKTRGRWIDDAPGQEWFLTTLAEIEAALKFIQAV